MTIEEFKEDLNDYMGEGIFDVKLVDNDNRRGLFGNIYIDPVLIIYWWDDNHINYVQAIDPKLLEMKPRNVCEGVVRPIVMKFKKLKNNLKDK